MSAPRPRARRPDRPGPPAAGLRPDARGSGWPCSRRRPRPRSSPSWGRSDPGGQPGRGGPGRHPGPRLRRLHRAGERVRSLGIVVVGGGRDRHRCSPSGCGLDTTTALVFIGLVLYRLAKIVMPMALWDAATERLDIASGQATVRPGRRHPADRAGRRLRLGAAAGHASIGTTGLFAVAAVALGGGRRLAAVGPATGAPVARDGRRGAPPGHAVDARGDACDRPRSFDAARCCGAGWCLPLLVAAAATTTACYTILSFSFSLAGGQRYPSADSLATAVALVSATSATLGRDRQPGRGPRRAAALRRCRGGGRQGGGGGRRRRGRGRSSPARLPGPPPCSS